MNPLRLLATQLKRLRIRAAQAALLRNLPADYADIERSEWAESLRDPTAFYLRCYRYFHRRLPATVREHRHFFAQNGRGFGEDAFHVLWYLLFRELRPATFLEIGVFRGQTLTLAALLARHFESPCRIHGLSPFSPAGDAVSQYGHQVDYFSDTLAHFDHFSLPHPTLLRAYSTEAAARPFVASAHWDLVYIDGNHDYDVARSDWELCVPHVRVGGLIVLDDASLGTAFQPPAFATAGHPGPSRLAKEIPDRQFEEVLRVGHNRVFAKIA